MGYLEPIESIEGRRRFRVLSPVDGHEVGTFAVSTAADVKAAVAKARAAQPAWDATPVRERVAVVLRAVEILRKNADAYSDRMYAETGRAALDTLMIELFAALDSMNFYARNAERVLADKTPGMHLLRMKKARIAYRPLGVVGVISPWNGPFILSLNPSVQALLAGNTVLVKPSEVTPFSGQLVAELFAEAGLPDGVLQVLLGDGETGGALLDAGLDKIAFTGSVRTGRKVGEACGRNLIPCTLELGGKDAMVVCADADLERAAGGGVFGAMMNAGQFCSSTERVYVEAPVADEFIAKVVSKVKDLQVGRDIGPFISSAQVAIVEAHVQDAIAKGAKVLAGGQREGNAFQATVLVDVTHDMDVMTEETFGPIIPIMVVKDLEEGIRMANDSQFGLGASVWTKDKAKGDRIARRLIAGAVMVNESSMTYGALEMPFGGRKASGVGRVNGADALQNWCHALPIITDRFGAKEEAVWYPYTPEKTQKLRKALDVIWGTPLRLFIK